MYLLKTISIKRVLIIIYLSSTLIWLGLLASMGWILYHGIPHE